MSKFTSIDSGATILSKLNNTVVTVGLEIGADYVCDGTADDVQIQAALDYVDSLSGGTVFVRRGTYDITDSIALGDRTTLQGEGQGATILKVPAGNFQTLVPGASTRYPTGSKQNTKSYIGYKASALGSGNNTEDYGVYVNCFDFTLDVNGANQDFSEADEVNYSAGGIMLYPVMYSTVERVTVLNAGWVGILLYGKSSNAFSPVNTPSHNRILNCHVDAAGYCDPTSSLPDSVSAGILIDNQGSDGGLVAFNKVTNCTITGIMCEDIKNAKIAWNSVENCYYGISYISAYYCGIENNTILNSTSHGVKATGGDSSGSYIRNNTIIGSGGDGIYQATSFSIYEGNIIWNSGGCGISTFNRTYCRIRNNEIYNSGQNTEATYRAGILVDLTTSANNDSIIVGNFIFDSNGVGTNPAGEATMQYGIQWVRPTGALTVYRVMYKDNFVKSAVVSNYPERTNITFDASCVEANNMI